LGSPALLPWAEKLSTEIRTAVQYPENGFAGEGLNFLTGLIELIYEIATWEMS
jgi:hypothetical protein